MSSSNGLRINREHAGGHVLDRQFGQFLVISDGGGGEIAIDVERVVSIQPGQGEAAGGGKVNVTVVALAGRMQPALILSRGVVSVAESISRAREKWEAEKSARVASAKVEELHKGWFEFGERIRAQLRAWAEEQRADDERQARRHDRRCDACRAAADNTCPICDQPHDPSKPHLPPMLPLHPDDADVADVVGRAARAAAAGGGSGIVGTSIAGVGLAPGPLGPADNPHLESIERTGEIAGKPVDPDDQAAAAEEAAQRALGANGDPLDPNATG